MYDLEWWYNEWNAKKLKQRDLAWLRTKEGTVPVIIEHILKNGRYLVWLSNNKVVTCEKDDLIGIES